MQEFVKLFQHPRLNKPSLVAAWPGMGRVAMVAVNYLKNKLDAQLFGEVTPSDFFAPTGALVFKQLIQPIEPPKSQLFYYQSPASGNDIIFFIGSAQPIPHKEFAFASHLMEFAKEYKIGTVYTAAAAPSDMRFKDTPRVFAAANQPDLLKQMMELKVHFMGEGNIAGMNGLLISVAAEMKMRGVCLLGEIPFFTAQVEFPRASLAVLRVLKRILRIDVDLMDMELYAAKKDKEIEPLASLLTKAEPGSEQSEKEEDVIPTHEEKTPKHVRLRIEKLFRQAEFDRTYKSKMKLKEELDKWELFDEYLDRFLDLFKKPHGES